jgi:glutamate dehydrogenase/leucine dehydrogenase
VEVLTLRSVNGWVVRDVGEWRLGAGGTRLVAEGSLGEAKVLARAMTYKFALAGLKRVSGAKAVLVCRSEVRRDVLRRYCHEVRPLVRSLRFLTGPDLGTTPGDFVGLGLPPVPSDATEAEERATAMGIVAALSEISPQLVGRRVLIEGLGRVGAGVARFLAERGCRIVALSNAHGCIVDPSGVPIERVLRLRAQQGDRWIRFAGPRVYPPVHLFGVAGDILVTAARVGCLTRDVAAGLDVGVLVPASNAPYRVGVPERLRDRGIEAHADFVVNLGGILAYAGRFAPHREPIEALVRDLVAQARSYGGGPYAGACALVAERLPASHRLQLSAPPLAGSAAFEAGLPVASTR